MISGNTLNIDNPKLNCRLKGYENFSPKRIILDKNLDINFTSYIFKSAKKNNTIIFYNFLNHHKIKILKKKGINLIRLKLDKDNHFNLNLILKKLFKLGIRNLLLEGGDKITKNFLNRKLINRFYLFESPKKLSKSKKHLIFSSYSILTKVFKKNSKISSKLAKDKITIYKR